MTEHALCFTCGIIMGAAVVVIFISYNYRLIDRDLWDRFCLLMDDQPIFRDREDD